MHLNKAFNLLLAYASILLLFVPIFLSWSLHVGQIYSTSSIGIIQNMTQMTFSLEYRFCLESLDQPIWPVLRLSGIIRTKSEQNHKSFRLFMIMTDVECIS